LTTFLINQTIIARHGEATFTTAGSHTWLCPSGVTNVCIAVCGAGGYGGSNISIQRGSGGGGGGFAYVNNLRVYSGNTYNLQVGVAGGTVGVGGTGSSWFDSSTYLYATGGASGVVGTNSGMNGGGGGAAGYSANGGSGGGASTTYAGGIGGFGGGNAPTTIIYRTGGRGGYASSGSQSITAATLGVPTNGGAAAGGSGAASNPFNGGGVSYDGQTSYDANTVNTVAGGAILIPSNPAIATHNGGSNGTSGGIGTVGTTGGGSYGGGSAGGRSTAGGGFVRIIWGPNRSYPNTVTGTI
jgi:hypothetical protein